MARKQTINTSDLPRVLIIGQTFTQDTGGGITLSNLFQNWPSDRLALAIDSKENLDFSKCSNYYRVGYQELKLPFPFSIFQRKTKSGPINAQKIIGEIKVKENLPAKASLKRFFDDFLHRAGLYFWMYGNEALSTDLLNWIKTFDPQVIYYQPNSYKSLRFIRAIKDHVPVPLVVHVMDDWFSFIVRPSPLAKFWQRRLDKEVENVFALSQLHLSICDFMSEEYKKRYGYQFFPFHNSVDRSFWKVPEAHEKLPETPVKILYAGRIGYGLEKTIQKVADIVEKMGRDGEAVQFEIQTKDQSHPIRNQIQRYQFVSFSDTIPYKDLPLKFASAQILLIPCDFSGEGVKFIRYSMPTKVSEYMATGTPILVIGPRETALVEYARKGWAKVCTSNDNLRIESAIKELIDNKVLKKAIVEKSLSLVAQNHDEEKIVDQFQNMISALTNKTHKENQKPFFFYSHE